MKPHVFHSEADAEYTHAVQYYAAIRPELCSRLYDEMELIEEILRVYPESGESVIVLCNLDSPSASRRGDWLHARMPLK